MDVENIPEFNITIPSLQLFKHQKQYCTLLNLIQDKHAVYKYIENEKYYIRSDFFILDSKNVKYDLYTKLKLYYVIYHS